MIGVQCGDQLRMCGVVLLPMQEVCVWWWSVAVGECRASGEVEWIDSAQKEAVRWWLEG